MSITNALKNQEVFLLDLNLILDSVPFLIREMLAR